MTGTDEQRTIVSMSYQPPFGAPGQPPRSTPIPGQNHPGSNDSFNQVPPTPGAFLGGQPGSTTIPDQPTYPGQPSFPGQQSFPGQPAQAFGATGYPTIAYPKRKRSWGGMLLMIIILGGFLGGIGVAVWAVMKGVDAANQGQELADPDLSDKDRDSLGIDGPEEFLFEGGAAAAVATALDQAIPGEPTKFTQVLIYTDYAIVTAEDPTTPGRLDQYIWRTGVVGAPTAQPDDPEAADKTFTAVEVNWDAITALALDAPRLSGVEGGEVSYFIVGRDSFIEPGPIVVRIYVNGPRGSAVIEATAAGEFVKTF